MKVFAYRYNFSRSHHPVGRRREEGKLHRPAERQIEFPAADLHFMAFFMTSRNEAKRFLFPFAFQAAIKRVRGAAADPPPHPAADQRVIRGAAGNRQFERTVFEDRSGERRVGKESRSRWGPYH